MSTPEPAPDLAKSPMSDIRDEISTLLGSRGGRGKLPKDENVVGEDLAGSRVIEAAIEELSGVQLSAKYIYSFSLAYGEKLGADAHGGDMAAAMEREWIRGYLYLSAQDFSADDFPEAEDRKLLQGPEHIPLQNLACRQKWAATRRRRVIEPKSPVVETRKIMSEFRAQVINRLCEDIEVVVSDDAALRLLAAQGPLVEVGPIAAVLEGPPARLVIDDKEVEPRPRPVADDRPAASQEISTDSHTIVPSKKKRIRAVRKWVTSIDWSEVPNKIGEGVVLTVGGLLFILMWILLAYGVIFLIGIIWELTLGQIF